MFLPLLVATYQSYDQRRFSNEFWHVCPRAGGDRLFFGSIYLTSVINYILYYLAITIMSLHYVTVIFHLVVGVLFLILPRSQTQLREPLFPWADGPASPGESDLAMLSCWGGTEVRLILQGLAVSKCKKSENSMFNHFLLLRPLHFSFLMNLNDTFLYS